MFIPRGKLVHDNLATSYVLIEPLISELMESGFAGLVEINLRRTDSYIILAGTEVSAVQRLGAEFTRATVAQLADLARLERGRVAIYSYSESAARVVAGRVNAQTLYAGLSTESTDIERMVGKLAREVDREWFVEINLEGGLRGLIHLLGGRTLILSSNEGVNGLVAEPVESEGPDALENLLGECRHVRGTFDVLFARAGETSGETFSAQPAAFEAAALASAPDWPAPASAIAQHSLDSRQSEALRKLSAIELSISSSLEGEGFVDDFAAPDLDLLASVDAIGEAVDERHPALSLGAPDLEDVAEDPTLTDFAAFPVDQGEQLPLADESGVQATGGIQEIKRLMAEIARTVEEASQQVGPQEKFSMCLRAGQIKVAERYPFLDPFGGEFEYLGGEIVFVGDAGEQEFIEGFTAALALAIQAVTDSTAYPDRFRAYVAEDLTRLLADKRDEMESAGLDQVIEQLIRSQSSG